MDQEAIPGETTDDVNICEQPIINNPEDLQENSLKPTEELKAQENNHETPEDKNDQELKNQEKDYPATIKSDYVGVEEVEKSNNEDASDKNQGETDIHPPGEEKEQEQVFQEKIIEEIQTIEEHKESSNKIPDENTKEPSLETPVNKDFETERDTDTFSKGVFY
jgi:hypothetical protein